MKKQNKSYLSGLRSCVLAATVTLLTACSANQASSPDSDKVFMPTLNTFSANRIRADITFLADDMLLGRDTGSDGYRIAANYVAAEYARLGMIPAGDGNSYFQEVPFQKAKLNHEKAKLSAMIDGAEINFTLGDDYLMGGSVGNPSGAAVGSVVFVGYGVHAPDFGYDDFNGVDLTGKVALVLSGAPASLQTEIRAHYGSSSTKAEVLKAHGAVGIITVNSLTNEKRVPYSRMKAYLDREQFDWIRPVSDDEASGISATAFISHDTAKKLFEGAAHSFDDVLVSAEDGNVTSFPLKARVSMVRESILSEPVYSPNVIGVIEGSDPILKNEYVVLSAHLDHIGISANAKGEDKINNGALDNAAGVSVMMEVARAYIHSGMKPKRSILFAAVTGEEKGLLGAEYFAHFPTVPKANIVADVNLDMPVLLYDFSDVVAFGADRSSLGPITEKAVQSIGLVLSPDPMPQEGVFTRSDHYRFVQQGIPSVFLVTGFNKGFDNKNGGEVFMDFLHKTYHSPADEVSLPIDYQAAAKFAYVNWLISNAIANEAERPTWNKGDFFGDTFSK
ncbi:M28 family metallopeptidase [Kordiimonas pumila]|uniref:M28 family metallopeptidase n=1 Tax=Kordiimonas pumila TaxID=2161677 RepID=A0ABV7D8X5_9PROT|nr:M28 family metallopeptidase [Kordiimonas pumila]